MLGPGEKGVTRQARSLSTPFITVFPEPSSGLHIINAHHTFFNEYIMAIISNTSGLKTSLVFFLDYLNSVR